LERLQAIGSEVAAETSRSIEISAPAKTVAVSRKEAVISKTPWHFVIEPDYSGPCQYQCTGRANSKFSLFFSGEWRPPAELASNVRRQLV